MPLEARRTLLQAQIAECLRLETPAPDLAQRATAAATLEEIASIHMELKDFVEDMLSRKTVPSFRCALESMRFIAWLQAYVRLRAAVRSSA